MTTELKAILTHKGGDVFELNCGELMIKVVSKAPSPLLCREIMEKRPEFSESRVVVVSDTGEHRYTVTNVGSLAKKAFIENVNGIQMVKYVPFPKKGAWMS